MPSVFERLDNREAFPVPVKGGTVYVREPTMEEIDRMNLLKGDLKVGFGFGVCLVKEDGSREFTPEDNESDEAFAKRITVVVKRVLTMSGNRAVQEAILQLTKPVDPDELAKNSSQTPK